MITNKTYIRVNKRSIKLCAKERDISLSDKLKETFDHYIDCFDRFPGQLEKPNKNLCVKEFNEVF